MKELTAKDYGMEELCGSELEATNGGFGFAGIAAIGAAGVAAFFGVSILASLIFGCGGQCDGPA